MQMKATGQIIESEGALRKTFLLYCEWKNAINIKT